MLVRQPKQAALRSGRQGHDRHDTAQHCWEGEIGDRLISVTAYEALDATIVGKQDPAGTVSEYMIPLDELSFCKSEPVMYIGRGGLYRSTTTTEIVDLLWQRDQIKGYFVRGGALLPHCKSGLCKCPSTPGILPI